MPPICGLNLMNSTHCEPGPVSSAGLDGARHGVINRHGIRCNVRVPPCWQRYLISSFRRKGESPAARQSALDTPRPKGFSGDLDGSRAPRASGEKGTRCGVPIRDRIRGCPRNCERRAGVIKPLHHQWAIGPVREGDVRATTREPGDLPPRRAVPQGRCGSTGRRGARLALEAGGRALNPSFRPKPPSLGAISPRPSFHASRRRCVVGRASWE